jgi:hypothetical protein
MLDLLLAAIVAVHPTSANSALALCRPALARKAGGEIATIAIGKSSISGSSTRIGGRMTAFVGMGAPAPGSASAHHLIRADYNYQCWVRAGRVRKTIVTAFQ